MITRLVGDYSLERVRSQFVAAYRAAVAGTPAVDVLADLVMSDMGCVDCPTDAARAFLSVLIESLRLPQGKRLRTGDLKLVFELLNSYFGNASDTGRYASDVIALIERKFAAGEFSQARMLLKLFDTEGETGLNNERNLYYEEMSVRIDGSSKRRDDLPSAVSEMLYSDNAGEAEIIQAFTACERQHGVIPSLYLTDPDAYGMWRESLSVLDQGVINEVTGIVPISQWTVIGPNSEPLMERCARHMTFDILRRYVRNKLRMAYFILVVGKRTGFEWFVPAFETWSRDVFGVMATDVFPSAHRASVLEREGIESSLEQATSSFYDAPISRITVTREKLSAAVLGAARKIVSNAIRDARRGYYDFGGFVLDELLGFQYLDVSMEYRMHVIL